MTIARTITKVAIKVRDMLALLAKDGWTVTAQAGSHRQLEHPAKCGKVTVAGHPGDDLHPKTARSILRQAGIRK